MAVKTRDEIITSLRAKLGDDTSDEVITILEDVSDTFSDYESRITESDDWKTKYENLDQKWRKRYTERFYSNEEVEPVTIEETTEKIKNFDDLFKEEK